MSPSYDHNNCACSSTASKPNVRASRRARGSHVRAFFCLFVCWCQTKQSTSRFILLYSGRLGIFISANDLPYHLLPYQHNIKLSIPVMVRHTVYFTAKETSSSTVKFWDKWPYTVMKHARRSHLEGWCSSQLCPNVSISSNFF